MEFKNILYEKKDGIAKITLNRPEAMNSIDSDTHLELHEALYDIAHDKAVRVAILTATGRAFCTGADLKFAMTLQGDQQKAEDFIGQWRKTTETIANLPKPVIAAVNGIALAGGLELVMACDIIYAADNIKLGDQHANYGLIPGGGGTVRLPRYIGIKKAMELILTGDWISAKEAEAFGLINHAVPADKLMEEAMAMAQKLAKKSPLASKGIKYLVNTVMQVDINTALQIEASVVAPNFSSPDMVEGLRAFNEKREPVFKGE